MVEKLINGIVPALATPFDEENNVNVPSISLLVDRVISHGANGVYVCGRTGEAGSLTIQERKLIAETVIKEVAGQVPVIVHVGATTTENAIELARHAFEVGADGISSMAPMDNPTDIDVAVSYYKQIGEATSLPFYVYQIGPQWGVTAQVFLEKMYNVPNFRGIKYTHKDFYLMERIITHSKGELNVLSGPDEMCLAGLIMGTDGAIGSTYNVMTELFVRMYNDFKKGRISAAQEAQNKANDLIEFLFEPGFGDVPSIKSILNAQGIPVGNPRLPYLPVSSENQSRLMDIVNCYELK